MRYPSIIISLFMALLFTTNRVHAGEGVEPSRECMMQRRIVEHFKGVLDKGAAAKKEGDPEKSYQIYWRAAQTILEKYPGCKDIHARLIQALDRSGTLGRSTDRAEELKRCLYGIVTDYEERPASDGHESEPGSGEGLAEGVDPESSDSTDGTDDGIVYWLSDPYFLLLELILLCILFLIREIKRSRRSAWPSPPTIRPFRYREMPDRTPTRKRSGPSTRASST
jgi:hypothetical protein